MAGVSDGVERFTLTQCLQILGTNNHRLKKLLEGCGIVPEVSRGLHGRVRLVTADELERLRLAYLAVHRGRQVSYGERSDDIDLIGRVERLESDVREILSLLRGPERLVMREQRSVGERRYSGNQPRQSLPDGCVGWVEFAERHGIPRTTADYAIAHQQVSVVEVDLWVGSAHYKKLLDAGGQKVFIARFREHERFRVCNVPGCSCQFS